MVCPLCGTCPDARTSAYLIHGCGCKELAVSVGVITFGREETTLVYKNYLGFLQPDGRTYSDSISSASIEAAVQEAVVRHVLER